MSNILNKERVRRFYDEVFNNRNIHMVDEYVAESFVDHNPSPGQDPSISGLRQMLQGLYQAYPDLKVTVEQVIAEGDMVGVRFRATGTHLGELAEMPATGRRASARGYDWLKLKDGVCVERWGVFDDLGMMRQLGALPGPKPDELKKGSRRYFELLSAGRGDLAAIRNELFHPQQTTFFASDDRGMPPEAFQGLLQTFWKAFPDLHHEVVDQICEGDTIYNRLKITGTHKGEWAGVQSTNKKIAIEAIVAHVWQDGRIIQLWGQPDLMSALRQIGAVPAPR